MEHPHFEKVLNEDYLCDYLSFQYVPNENTLFKNVFTLPASCYLTYSSDEGLKVCRYFEFTYEIDTDTSLEEWKAKIKETFEESVAAHQISDVEVGCFLSSGVDSSLVVNEAHKASDRVKTFSVGYEETKYSELPHAQKFSKTIGVTNYPVLVSANDFFDAMPRIQYILDEPLPNPSSVPLYFLSKEASHYVKVVLSGEGADELFGGYPMYLQAGHFMDYTKKVPTSIRKMLAVIAKALPSFKGRNFLVRGAQKPYQRFMRSQYVFDTVERNRFLKPHLKKDNPVEKCKTLFDQVSNLDEITQLQYVDMYTWFIYDILLKADRMSMAHSLELRVPFLDKEVFNLARRIPSCYRADHQSETTKKALRQAALDALPEETARMKKLGFPVPLTGWLKEEKYYTKVKDIFKSSVAKQFFEVEELLTLLNNHREGKANNMQKIWSFYSFLIWYDEFFVKR